jgi:alkylation response protein AidB-like acyl-CoA dehydrogenase
MLEALVQRARTVGAESAPKLEALGESEAAREALRALSAAGLVAWCVPERDGGAAKKGLAEPDSLSVLALCALRRELAAHSGMLDVMLAMQGLGSFALALAGGEALRKRWLPRVAKGAAVAAFALTEPDAGSSLSEIATRATRTGTGWRLEGRKTFISNAGIADLYTVLARTAGEPGDKEGGLSMLLVPGDAPGLAAQRFEVLAPHPIGDLVFEGVEVPADHLLGEEGQGLALALSVLGRFRTTVAAAACGFARRALEESERRLNERRQFGRPLASFQALRFDVAEMDVRLRAAELLVGEAAESVDEGWESTLQVARAKLFATEAASWICDRAVQLHGGLGVKKGTVVERLWRDVRALRIYEGTSEVQKLVIAKELLDRER